MVNLAMDKPWIDKIVEEKSKERDIAYKNAVHINTDESWNRYRICRNDLIGDKKISFGTKSIEFNNILYTEPEIIAHKFNEFFIQSIEEIVEEIGIIADDQNLILNDMNADRCFDKFQIVQHNDLEEIINRLNNRKGSNNEITADIIKMVWKCDSRIILDVINKSLQEGEVPDEWKTSIITPIPKVNGSIKAEEYRPINTLPIHEKVLEQVVKSQLMKYINKKEVLIKQQSGFRTGFSCETALQDTLIEWRKYGVKRTVLAWFDSYLNNRKQQVKYGKIISEELLVRYGVPQGSKLVPLLFIIYINDVVQALEGSGCSCKLFADDMILYVASDDRRCVIRVEDNMISEVEEHKYLGIIIDENLSFGNHAWYMAKKVGKKIGFLNLKKKMDMIQKTQNRAMQSILMVNMFTPIRTMLDVLGFMSGRERMKYNICVLVYKMKNGLAPEYLRSEIRTVSERHGYNTRNKNDLEVRRTRTVTAGRTLVYEGFQVYNELPREIKNARTIEIFKGLVKEYIKINNR
ncbi:uncharacterized protein LOC124406219 [Diprion similis]|uniref:uncharacterized protein LOC124406219 n=1 Tax=Diprion similis TaxID=362088 RepID=UPI001EF92B62|nr:uncharacterized protein LOC124406219 [Diprion similis]